jgi:hypothetical protein
MPEMHQIGDQVVLLVFRHTGQFFLNLLERHIQETLRPGLPKTKRGKHSLPLLSRPPHALGITLILSISIESVLFRQLPKRQPSN